MGDSSDKDGRFQLREAVNLFRRPHEKKKSWKKSEEVIAEFFPRLKLKIHRYEVRSISSFPTPPSARHRIPLYFLVKKKKKKRKTKKIKSPKESKFQLDIHKKTAPASAARALMKSHWTNRTAGKNSKLCCPTRASLSWTHETLRGSDSAVAEAIPTNYFACDSAFLPETIFLIYIPSLTAPHSYCHAKNCVQKKNRSDSVRGGGEIKSQLSWENFQS